MASLWTETALIRSNIISQSLGCSAYLKLENLHPSHSFKYRGISHFIQHAKATHGPSVHLVIASGGNAGLAAACAAHALSVRCTVFIPDGAAASTIELLRDHSAEVVVGGVSYLHALEAAKEMTRLEEAAVMVPAYDDPLVWEGHSSIIKELKAQLGGSEKPAAVFCSVGGGGLLGGIIIGCRLAGWEDVPIIALETIGSDCFYHTMQLQRNPLHLLPQDASVVSDDQHGLKLAFFNRFSSRASGSLGASSPASDVVKMAMERAGGVKCVSIPDELAMQVGLKFADDHKVLVELACSTTLAPAYKRSLFAKLVPPGARTVVFIVCGGFKVSLKEMKEYETQVQANLGTDDDAYWNVLCDGEVVRVEKN